MAKDPAFLFYPGDWLGGTIHMTHVEKGCYMDLLVLQFNKGKFTLAQAKHMLNGSFEVAWANIEEKFTFKDGLYFNERLAYEKEKRAAFSESRKNNASKPKSSSKKDEASAEHMLQHMEDENENRIIGKVITYLNEKSGKIFKTTSAKSKAVIKARLNEGYVESDLLKVVEVKCDKWGKDPKMVDFIRPETLFGTKFESYLNETVIPAIQPKRSRFVA